MRKCVSFIMVCLMVFLLSGCGQGAAVTETAQGETMAAVTEAAETTAPETNPYAGMTEEEKAVAQCRAVLDAVQSEDSYHITLTKWHEGVWDSTQQIEYYRNGDNRAMRGKSTGSDDSDGQFPGWMGTGVRVQVDDVTYSGYQETGKEMQWDGQVNDNLNFDPWMYTFDWDAQEVELLEILKTAEGRSVSFKVHDVYDIDYGFAEDYTITFYFDEEGNFIERELIATAQETTPSYREENGEWVRLKPGDPGVEKTGRVITRVDHVTVESIDPEVVGAAIDGFYQDAIAYEKG